MMPQVGPAPDPSRAIAVTGASGVLGGRVAARLSGAGAPLRLVVRDPARAPSLPGAEVVATPGGYADGAGLQAALTGVDTVYLVSAAEAPDRLEQHRAAVAAAAAAGVRRIVYTSFLGASPGATFLLRDDDDLAGATLDVTGPEALPLAEAAAVLTEVTGRPAEYREQTVEQAWQTRRPSGHPDWEIEGWVSSYLAIAAGELSPVTDVVPRLTGHPARTVAEHLRAHPEDWAHLRA
jgi:uncharacterized protein YbjT (DUF2867 family)